MTCRPGSTRPGSATGWPSWVARSAGSPHCWPGWSPRRPATASGSPSWPRCGRSGWSWKRKSSTTATNPRFADPAWLHNPWYFHWAQQHSAGVRHLRQLVVESDLDGAGRAKATLAVEQIANALAPSNFPASNPTAAKEAFDTGGASILRGGRNVVRDAMSNSGRPLQVDRSAYALGQHLALTPGRVVFRNRLAEVIQYEPRTDKSYATPMIFVPPWINKYYLFDLHPGRSLIDWAVHYGHTRVSRSAIGIRTSRSARSRWTTISPKARSRRWPRSPTSPVQRR